MPLSSISTVLVFGSIVLSYVSSTFGILRFLYNELPNKAFIRVDLPNPLSPIFKKIINYEYKFNKT